MQPVQELRSQTSRWTLEVNVRLLGILNVNGTFPSRCMAEAGSVLLSCFLQPSRLTFTRSRLAGGSWWLPGVTLSFGHCRSDHINPAGPGKVKRTLSSQAQSSKSDSVLQICKKKKSGSSRSAWNQGRPFLVRRHESSSFFFPLCTFILTHSSSLLDQRPFQGLIGE